MSSGLVNNRRYPRARASCSSGVPGSVIATKESPARSPATQRTHSNAACSNEETSSVVPDLEDTTTSVVAGSWLASAASTEAGEVLSSTVTGIAP
jgi:hypothetical protein